MKPLVRGIFRRRRADTNNKEALAHGTVITVCSQCPQGSVSLGTYETSSGLKNAGAVCGWDMTTEAAVAKLYYLFSCGYTADMVRGKNGRGHCRGAHGTVKRILFYRENQYGLNDNEL